LSPVAGIPRSLAAKAMLPLAATRFLTVWSR
jgi:hypothetical protein